MSDITSITFSIGDNTFQICNGSLYVWKGIPDDEHDIEIDIQDLRNVMKSADFLRTDNEH